MPATVERAGAAEFLDRLELREGTTTVVWHSVMWQYLPTAEQDAVRRRVDVLGAAAGDPAGFAHASFEPRRRAPGHPHEFLVTVRTWPGGAQRVLGSASPHGIPTTWE